LTARQLSSRRHTRLLRYSRPASRSPVSGWAIRFFIPGTRSQHRLQESRHLRAKIADAVKLRPEGSVQRAGPSNQPSRARARQLQIQGRTQPASLSNLHPTLSILLSDSSSPLGEAAISTPLTSGGPLHTVAASRQTHFCVLGLRGAPSHIVGDMIAGMAASSDASARLVRHLGTLLPELGEGYLQKYDIGRPERNLLPADSRSLRFRAELRPQHRFDRSRSKLAPLDGPTRVDSTPAKHLLESPISI